MASHRINNSAFLNLEIISNMNPFNTYIASNSQGKTYATDIPMSIHQPLRPFIHGNLDRTCQSRMNGIDLERFIQKHEDIKSL